MESIRLNSPVPSNGFKYKLVFHMIMKLLMTCPMMRKLSVRNKLQRFIRSDCLEYILQKTQN